jgi:hypothetical protein
MDFEKVMGSEDVGKVLGLLVHEMKTGLCVMLGGCEQLVWTHPELEGDEHLRDSVLFGHYLVGVLDGLSYVSRVSRGGEREREEIRVREVAQEVAELFEGLEDRRVVVSGIDEKGEGSRVLWREILFGLVMNGVVHGKGDVCVACGGEGFFSVTNEVETGHFEGEGEGVGIVKMLASVEGLKLEWHVEEGGRRVRVWVRA